MSVYHKWKVVFIQIPKNATWSIHGRLANKTDCSVNHNTYFEILNNHDVELIESYYSFAVVRNPYDRFVSAFEYCKTVSKEIPKDSEFDDFIKNLEGKSMSFFAELPLPFSPQYRFITIKNIVLVDDLIRFENIDEDWKKVSKNINESLKKRHESVGKNYSFVSCKLELSNITPSRFKENIYKTVDDFYKNKESKEIIYELYRKDFEIFKYEK